MEREDDVQVIHAVLSGDDSAFGTLVEKYQKVFMPSRGGKSVISTMQKKLRKILSSARIRIFQRSEIPISFLGGCMSLRIGFVCIGCANKNQRSNYNHWRTLLWKKWRNLLMRVTY